jgi:hypothetical protein
MMFLSGRGEPSKKCMRCGMHYMVSDLTCPYCVGKSNAEIIRDIHIPQSENLEKASKLGKYFIVISIITGVVLLSS